MGSREKILSQLRAKSAGTASDLPNAAGPWIEYPDVVAQFTQMVQTVGGTVRRCNSRKDALAAITTLDVFTNAKRIVSCVEGLEGSPDHGHSGRPTEFDDVDVCIAESKLAVAENGAAWLDTSDTHIQEARAALFLTQHLVLLVPSRGIVHNLHQAYERLLVTRPGYGVFISGPSKTADIEQSLVIGAHGARSATVLVFAG